MNFLGLVIQVAVYLYVGYMFYDLFPGLFKKIYSFLLRIWRARRE